MRQCEADERYYHGFGDAESPSRTVQNVSASPSMKKERLESGMLTQRAPTLPKRTSRAGSPAGSTQSYLSSRIVAPSLVVLSTYSRRLSQARPVMPVVQAGIHDGAVEGKVRRCEVRGAEEHGTDSSADEDDSSDEWEGVDDGGFEGDTRDFEEYADARFEAANEEGELWKPLNYHYLRCDYSDEKKIDPGRDPDVEWAYPFERPFPRIRHTNEPSVQELEDLR